jgi:hypothetical protein
VKTDPTAGAAVSVTGVPRTNDAEHVVGHETPAGLLVTVPVPLPAGATVTANAGGRIVIAIFAVFESTSPSLATNVNASSPICPAAGV